MQELHKALDTGNSACYLDRVLLALDRSVLEIPTKPVTDFNDELRALGRDLTETMFAAGGIGLAANQVGVGLSVCVVRMKALDGNHFPMILVNPKIAEHSRELVEEEEGCLSLPGIQATLGRPVYVRVEYQTTEGRPMSVESEGVGARALFHEFDHLAGALFIQRLSKLKQASIRRRLKKLIRGGG